MCCTTACRIYVFFQQSPFVVSSWPFLGVFVDLSKDKLSRTGVQFAWFCAAWSCTQDPIHIVCWSANQLIGACPRPSCRLFLARLSLSSSPPTIFHIFHIYRPSRRPWPPITGEGFNAHIQVLVTTFRLFPQLSGYHTAHCDNRIQRKEQGGNGYSYGRIKETKCLRKCGRGTQKVRVHRSSFIFSEQHRFQKLYFIRWTLRRTFFNVFRMLYLQRRLLYY